MDRGETELTDVQSFARWLLDQRLLSKADLRRARDAQRGRMGNLDTEIIDLQLMSERDTLEALGRFHKTRTVAGSELEFASPSAIRMLTPRIASRLGVVPFKLEGRTISVATLSPGDLLVEDEIAQQTGCMVASFVALEIRFVEALNRHYQTPITARYAGLIRRLTGVKDKVKEGYRAPPRDELDSAPPRAPEAVKQPAVDRRRPSAPKAAEPLELSAEELDLFPSLRIDQAEAVDAAGSIAGEVDLARENQPEERAQPEEPTRSEEPVPPTVVAPPDEPVPLEQPAPSDEADGGLEALLHVASHAMQNVEMRDDIADAMLGFCAPIFRRRMMLVLRGSTIMGWRGEGAGVDQQVVRAINIPTDEPSVFSGLLQGVEFWLGPLPAMPHNADLTMALGGPSPKDCYVMPVKVRDRVVCFLYGDNQDEGVGGLPLAEFKRLAGKAGLAFQVYLLKGKIRAS
jgi:MshEN domain